MSRALSPARNSEPPHPVLQRGTLHSELGGRTIRSGNSPMRLLENSKNLLAFAFIKCSPGVPRVGDKCFVTLLLIAGRMAAGLEIAYTYFQHRPCGYDHGTFNHVLQFANIARPVVFAQRGHGRCRNRINVLPQAPGKLLYKVSYQERNVLSPVTQGWHMNWKNVQPVEQ